MIQLLYLILHILLVLILLVLFLFLLLLILPIQYRVQGQLNEDFHLGAEIRSAFLYRIVGDIRKAQRCFTVRLLGIRLPQKNRPQSQQSLQVKKKSRSTSRPSANDLKTVFSRELLQEALRLLSRSYQHIKPSSIYLQGNYGFEEPQHTAWMLPLIGIVNRWDSTIQIDLVPVWDEACLDIDLNIKGRIIPGFLLLLMVRLLFSKPVRPIIKNQWKKKNKYRKPATKLIESV